ncbi:MAG: hypothetical protein KDB88_04700 [Flavobacteriales bacterium]|nr:hypothetical protein [Flavobacteriales bacterium]
MNQRSHASNAALAVAMLSFLHVPGQTTCLEAKRSTMASHRAGMLQDQRSDSVDILHTRLDLDLTDQVNAQLRARCQIDLTARVPMVDELRLDLIGLTVDSVRWNGSTTPFTHDLGVLRVPLPLAIGPGDTASIEVLYHGTPLTDPSGFGGFYFEGAYMYDLGVAFESQPHSFGRSWFPCFDNFVERSTHEFHVTCQDGNVAWCNGTFEGETQLIGDTVTYSWRLDETIPSYLASVAAAPYVALRDTFPSIGGSGIPVDLVSLPGDTADLRASFTNLQEAFDAFEECFGPYYWDRVGYCLAPRGAMEHSTSITYPVFIANGNLQYEATMAHELAHQWFGDLVTCDRAEEMYINEGFAEYLSFLFLEAVYGQERYLEVVRENHYDMLRRCHWNDGGNYYALADVPQDWTYGEHSYNKGADVLHSLRSYLGNSSFCSGLTSFLNSNSFRAVNSEQLRDELSANTGVDLTDFFEDWVFQPGWAGFEVDSFTVAPPLGGVFPTMVHVEQKLRGAVHPYNGVPMSLTCLDANGNTWTTSEPVVLGGWTSSVEVLPPFHPVSVQLNTDERLSIAVTGSTDSIADLGPETIGQANLIYTVNALTSPFVLRTEQYWVAADTWTAEPLLYRVSPDRWWRIDGDLPPGTALDARFNFDGRPLASGGLDVALMQDYGGVTFHEDSLVLLFRSSAEQPWEPFTDFTVNTLGDPTNKMGRIDANDVVPGDYTLGFRHSALSTNDQTRTSALSVFPEPASDLVRIQGIPPSWMGQELVLSNSQGQEVRRTKVKERNMSLSVSDLVPGPYFITVVGGDKGILQVGRTTVVR